MNLKTFVTIDWISYTLALKKRDFVRLWGGYDDLVLARFYTGLHIDWQPARTHHGYQTAYAPKDTAYPLVLLRGAGEGNDIHIQWSGRALGMSAPEDVLKYAMFVGGRVSRLDIALDVEAGLDFRSLYEAARAGKLDTKARKARIIESGDGTTVYIGSRWSSQYLRVYDKAAEAGLSEPRTRIELEIKGHSANGCAQYLVKHGLTDIPSIIKAFCNWPDNDLWEEIFRIAPKIAVPKADKEKDRARWLRAQVAPALIQSLQDGLPEAMNVLVAAYANLSEEQRQEYQRKCGIVYPPLTYQLV